EVSAGLGSGKFGMAHETGALMNAAINSAAGSGVGLGEALGNLIVNGVPGTTFPYQEISILARAYNKRIPVTVHVALGTDIIHAHPEASGKATGEASQHDFRLFCTV